jgi:tetrahydromethanopterin S-methyltransferase subunit B
MTYIKLLPEFGLSYNIENGKVEPEAGGAGGVVKYNFKPINESIDKLDKYTDDLMNSLVPTGAFLESFPGRTMSIYYASIWTNIFYGFIVGGIAACVFVLIWFAKVQGLM